MTKPQTVQIQAEHRLVRADAERQPFDGIIGC